MLDIVFPSVCPACDLPLKQGPTRFCRDCRDFLYDPRASRCPSCWLPYPGGGTDHPCEPCLRKPPPFSTFRAAGVYRGNLRKTIQLFKFEKAIHLDSPLAELLHETLSRHPLDPRPDLIVPVPLHPLRLRRRGYNQALLLARRIGGLNDLPVAARRLVRRVPTLSQQSLRSRDRGKNLRRAFALTGPFNGENILLVDDVFTTGATARECAETLLAGGARTVSVGVLGRAQRHLF